MKDRALSPDETEVRAPSPEEREDRAPSPECAWQGFLYGIDADEAPAAQPGEGARPSMRPSRARAPGPPCGCPAGRGRPALHAAHAGRGRPALHQGARGSRRSKP